MSEPALRHSAPTGIWSQVTLMRDATMATQSIDVKVASNGRMILPASVRKAMGLHGDAKVILTVEDDQVRLSPIGHGVSRAQALYREHAKQARTIDDFLSDRQAEAITEAGESLHSDRQRDSA
jgi:AbrB family looped-hinge helix DNA binding protein